MLLSDVQRTIENIARRVRALEVREYATGGNPPGVVPLPADTVVTEQTFGQDDNPGAAATFSRGDHTHGTPPLPPTGDNVGEGPGIDLNLSGGIEYIGLGGDSILLYDSGGNPVAEFTATSAGLDAALAAATAGDVVLLPACTIAADHTIPANVELTGTGVNSVLSGNITNNGSLSFLTCSGTVSGTGTQIAVRNGDVLTLYKKGASGDGIVWDSGTDELRIVGLIETTAVSADDVQYWRAKSATGLLLGYLGEASALNLGGLEVRGFRDNDNGGGVLIRGARKIGTSPAAEPYYGCAVAVEAIGQTASAEDALAALPADYDVFVVRRRTGAGDTDLVRVMKIDWDGNAFFEHGYVSASRFVSTVAVGTQPVTVASATLCTNLNADMLDGLHANEIGAQGQTKVIGASEALTAGDLVDIWNDSGTVKVRKASASAGYPAEGFVLANVGLGANATVYLFGTVTGLGSLTAGARQFLSTAGARTETAPSTEGYIVQEVGVALSATEMKFEPQPTVLLA